MSDNATPSSTATKPRRRWRRWCFAILCLATFLWLSATFAVTWYEIHRRHAVMAEVTPPAALGAENVRLKTTDGEDLGAWLMRGHEDKAIVILLHGVGGSRRNFLPLMERLHADGYGALAITMRGHGDSTGDLIDFGYSARADVVSGVSYLEHELPNRKIVICGTSMGSAAAMFAARDLGDRVSGYLLESPYTDLKTATWNRVKLFVPSGLDDVAYAGLWMWGCVLLPTDPAKISPCDACADVPLHTPVIILSSEKDRHATFEEAQAICARVASHGKVIRFSGASHARLFARDPERYYKALISLMPAA